MAKETKAKRRSAGRKAARDRVKAAKRAGKKSIKIGKNHIPLSRYDADGRLHKGGKKAAKKKTRKSKAKSSAPRKATRKASSKPRKSAKRAAARRASPKKRRKVTTRTRTITIRGKGRTRTITQTRTRKIRSGLAENPLTGMEIFAGGLTMLLGLGSADLLDRTLATHALTASGTNFADSPTDANGKPQMLNGQAVLAPMNMKRWLAGGAITVVPFVVAAYVKGPTLRSSLQLFGFGAAARVLGKGVKDLVVKMLPSKGSVQRFYAPELAAENAAVAFAASQPGATPPAAGAFFPTPNLPAVGLGHRHHAGTGDMTSGSGDRVGGTGDRATTAGCKCGGACGACRARSGVTQQQVAAQTPVGPPPPPPPPGAYAPSGTIPGGYVPAGYAPGGTPVYGGGYGPPSQPSSSPAAPTASTPTATPSLPAASAPAGRGDFAPQSIPAAQTVNVQQPGMSGRPRYNPYGRLQRVA